MKCRNCKKELTNIFLDLGASPPSNSFLSKKQLEEPELYYPLKVMTCEACFLVQVDEYKKTETIFNEDYVYFSSFSKSWLEHAKLYSEKVIKRFELSEKSFVVEVASNDGYLLKNFVKEKIPCLGVEPTKSTAQAARENGVESEERFFGVEYAKELVEKRGKADLVIGNNVLAHVPDLHDFIKGFYYLLKNNGVVTLEFPHLLELVLNNQFDTVYHEHFSYLSLGVVKSMFEKHGMRIFDVEKLPTHGGSLRVYACLENAIYQSEKSVESLIEFEKKNNMDNISYYQSFQNKAERIKLDFLKFLIDAKEKGLRVVAYGAAAKGNTLLNFSGVKSDLISYVVDASPYKQGLYLPGSRIPVMGIDHMRKNKPDIVIIFPWNIKEEIVQQLKGEFDNLTYVTFVPQMEILWCRRRCT